MSDQPTPEQIDEAKELFYAIPERVAVMAVARALATRDAEIARLRDGMGPEPGLTWQEITSDSDLRTRQAVDAIMRFGHTYHCAARLAWGDGECECGGRALTARSTT